MGACGGGGKYSEAQPDNPNGPKAHSKRKNDFMVQ